MRHHTRQLTIVIENHPIRARSLGPIENRPVRQNRELVIRTRSDEGEILVVVFAVRVPVAADRLAVLVVVAPGLLRVGDCAAVVEVAAAGCAAGLAFCGLRGGWG